MSQFLGYNNEEVWAVIVLKFASYRMWQLLEHKFEVSGSRADVFSIVIAFSITRCVKRLGKDVGEIVMREVLKFVCSFVCVMVGDCVY